MRAATIREKEIVIEEHPDPVAQAGEVLVRVHAAGLNGADMMQRRGLYPAPPGSPQDIPGMELAGEVAALGPGARALRGGRARDGDRRRRRAGRARDGARAPADAGPRRLGLAGRGRAAGGLHHRARRAVRAGRAALRRAPARARRRRRRGHRGDPARAGRGRAGDRDRAPRGAARAGGGARRRGDRAGGLRRARPVRRDPRAGRRARTSRRTCRRSPPAGASRSSACPPAPRASSTCSR